MRILSWRSAEWDMLVTSARTANSAILLYHRHSTPCVQRQLQSVSAATCGTMKRLYSHPRQVYQSPFKRGAAPVPRAPSYQARDVRRLPWRVSATRPEVSCA